MSAEDTWFSKNGFKVKTAACETHKVSVEWAILKVTSLLTFGISQFRIRSN